MNEVLQESDATLISLETEQDNNLNKALVLFTEKRYSEALNLLLPGLEQDKTGLYANFIGNCYQKLGSINDAIHFWQKAITKNPTCYLAFLSLGNAAYSQNNINQALVYWHIALCICPENAQLNYNIATAYSRKDERFLAVYYYEKFLKYSNTSNNNDIKHVTNLIINLRAKAAEFLKKASAAIARDKINQAVQYYIKSVKNYPLQPKVVQNIAKIFACDRNFAKAIEYYKMAIRIDDKLKICMVDIANAYLAKHQYELAYCYFSRFLNSFAQQSGRFAEIERITQYAKGKISPEYDATSHFNMAIQYEKDLKYREALDEYENYALLSEDNKESVAESIKKLKLMIYPEKFLISNLVDKIEELNHNQQYEQALKLCDRISVISVLNSHEFHWANKKKQELRYLIYRGKEGKK